MLKTIADISPALLGFIEELDLPLSRPQKRHIAQVADTLNDFHVRWSCEVANWYIKERLGWADCRLWKVESAERF